MTGTFAGMPTYPRSLPPRHCLPRTVLGLVDSPAPLWCSVALSSARTHARRLNSQEVAGACLSASVLTPAVRTIHSASCSVLRTTTAYGLQPLAPDARGLE